MYAPFITRTLVALAATVVMILPLPAPANPAEKAYQGFETRGRADFAAKCGGQTCAIGCRYFGNDDGVGMLASAPDWKIYSVNWKKKLYFPLSDFHGHNQLSLAHAGVIGDKKNAKWEQAADGIFLGRKTHSWRLYITPKSANKRSPVDYWEFIAFADMPVSQSFAEFGSDFHEYPKVKYCCARMQHIRTNRKPEIYYDTFKISERTFTKSHFMVPADFKRAGSIFEVSMEMEGMDDVLKDLSR